MAAAILGVGRAAPDFRKLRAGNVGIGTTSPQSALHVANNYLQIANNSNAAPPVADCDATTEIGRVYYTYNFGGGFDRLYICGNNPGGTVGWRFKVFDDAADLAETYPVFDDSIEAGDLVALSRSTRNVRDPNFDGGTHPVAALRKASRDTDPPVGIVATRPSLLNPSPLKPEEEPIPLRAVALVGRLPVKVNNESGPIQIGDYLASSSRPGYAAKATRSGRVVGVALEAFDGKRSKEGKILCFVNPHVWIDPGEHVDLRARQDRLEGEIQELRSRLRAQR